MPRVIIANRLTDGRVVFLGSDHRWVDDIDLAVTATSDEEVGGLEFIASRAEADCVVVDAYPIDVDINGDRLVPTVPKEAIRAAGPSVQVAVRRRGGL